ncbi:uncharacterized protein LOC133544396 isoform X2 [Nerophis ophidion]|uniref:uncharacterized protein LOC133544396 isoform X2 n=1 Tax=Nerophis ophidion TaxID=159077 RepID=UPI002ADFB34C|nr:uncharacterized protein LOC133544396 isoform X2 [Nerophis ophidion]
MTLTWTVQVVSILALLHLTTTSESDGDDCDLKIQGRKNIFSKVPVGKNLEIHCTITYSNTCKDPFENVFWYKLENKTYLPVTNDSHAHIELTVRNALHKILSLLLTTIQISDAGLYRCQSERGLSLGNPINISVQAPEGEAGRISGGYLAVGALAFGIILTCIYVIAMQRRKGNTKRENHFENQDNSMANPHIDAKSVACRRTASDPPTTKATPPSTRLPRSGQMSPQGEDKSKKNTIQDRNSIMYATLDHQLPPGGAVRPLPPMEESSEYAVIR